MPKATRTQVPRSGEELRIKPRETGECEVHDWPSEGMGLRLVQAMRDRLAKGINACRPCLDRALADAKKARS